jgi:formate dehydrogenase subunit gamma
VEASSASDAPPRTVEGVARHALADRLFHWIAAAAALVLLGTAFLPILGLKFAWVALHWSAGIVLIAAVAFHVVRASFWQDWRTIWFDGRDVRDGLALIRWNLRRTDAAPPTPGKYSLAQKLIHLAFAVVVLVACVTGATMMVKIDTPWWDRHLYWLSDETWGYVYVLHGLAALTLVTMVIAHVYFALRPEKLYFTRSMIRGWISRAEYEAHHDTNRWRIDE